jgi:hypothetical protein
MPQGVVPLLSEGRLSRAALIPFRRKIHGAGLFAKASAGGRASSDVPRLLCAGRVPRSGLLDPRLTADFSSGRAYPLGAFPAER